MDSSQCLDMSSRVCLGPWPLPMLVPLVTFDMWGLTCEVEFHVQADCRGIVMGEFVYLSLVLWSYDLGVVCLYHGVVAWLPLRAKHVTSFIWVFVN